jgi:hypothetical protein
VGRCRHFVLKKFLEKTTTTDPSFSKQKNDQNCFLVCWNFQTKHQQQKMILLLLLLFTVAHSTTALWLEASDGSRHCATLAFDPAAYTPEAWQQLLQWRPLNGNFLTNEQGRDVLAETYCFYWDAAAPAARWHFSGRFPAIIQGDGTCSYAGMSRACASRSCAGVLVQDEWLAAPGLAGVNAWSTNERGITYSTPPRALPRLVLELSTSTVTALIDANEQRWLATNGTEFLQIRMHPDSDDITSPYRVDVAAPQSVMVIVLGFCVPILLGVALAAYVWWWTRDMRDEMGSLTLELSLLSALQLMSFVFRSTVLFDWLVARAFWYALFWGLLGAGIVSDFACVAVVAAREREWNLLRTKKWAREYNTLPWLCLGWFLSTVALVISVVLLAMAASLVGFPEVPVAVLWVPFLPGLFNLPLVFGWESSSSRTTPAAAAAAYSDTIPALFVAGPVLWLLAFALLMVVTGMLSTGVYSASTNITCFYLTFVALSALGVANLGRFAYTSLRPIDESEEKLSATTEPISTRRRQRQQQRKELVFLR